MPINDPRWGRSSDPKNDDDKSQDVPEENNSGANRGKPSQNDLDQLWDDFNKLLGGVLGPQDNNRRSDPFGSDNGGGSGGGDDNGSDNREPSEPPRRRVPNFSMKAPKPNFKFLGLAFAAVVLLWGATGFYIVPEGQIGVVTTFGRYTRDATAGFNWHIPYPIQDAEIVDISSVRKVEVGIHGATNRLKEALMLTDDENIVDVMFNVQYRIKPDAAKDFLFKTRNPDLSVFQAAESAMREVVGRKTMDSVLFENKLEIVENVKQAMQAMLDRYQTGIEVMSVAIQNAQPPEQVQAAFNDAVKAGQDRERQINEGEAYANAVIPKAKGLASRLRQEAEGYKTRVVETATGDAERFEKILTEYQKAPRVTRDRMYVDAMRDIYSSATKVYVDTKGSNSLLYLPFDKLLEKSKTVPAAAASSATTSTTTTSATSAATTPVTNDPSTDLDPRTLMRLRGR